MMVSKSVLATINSEDGFDHLNPHNTTAPGRQQASTQSKEYVLKKASARLENTKHSSRPLSKFPFKNIRQNGKLVSFLNS
jgi:hypothetical protein